MRRWKTGFAFVDGDEALGRAPARPRSWIACAALALAAGLGLQILSLPYIPPALTPLVPEHRAAVFVLANLIIPYAALAAAAIFVSWGFDRRGPDALGLRPAALAGAVPWIAAGLVAAAPSLLLIDRLSESWTSVLGPVALLTPATIVQAGAEEILFRGIVLASLASRYGAQRGVLISAIMFALWHAYVGQSFADFLVQVVGAFVFGLTSALLVLRQGHLGGAIALHVVWNVASDARVGLTKWPEAFWKSLADVEPWTMPDLLGFGVQSFMIPLLLETMLVLAACRATLARVMAQR
jgi:membrane protease YdiL (CAAX protease family)